MPKTLPARKPDIKRMLIDTPEYGGGILLFPEIGENI
jgi:hypothetical protein